MGITVPPDSTGKIVETNSPDGVSQRQVVSLGDTATAAAVAKVQNADPGSTDYGVTTRDVRGNAALPVRTDPTGTTPQPITGSVSNTGFAVNPPTSGGTSAYHAVAAASNNSAVVKNSAGQVFGFSIFNNANYPIFVKLYNKATAPAPATDNALLIRVIAVQAGQTVPYFNPCGISGFTNGIGIAAVKGITDTDNTSLAVNDALIEVDYK